MVANIFFSVLVSLLLLVLLEGFFVLLSVYPQVAFMLMLFGLCLSAYYDYCGRGC